jgi:hypothetical protein
MSDSESTKEKILNEPTLTARDLIAWVEKTSNGWRNLLAGHPELLDVPCDISNVHTVAQLLQHIVAVELRYAERLADLPATDYANVPCDSVERIYATHDHAFAVLQKLLDSEMNWDEPIEFSTRVMGPARSTRKTILFPSPPAQYSALRPTRHSCETTRRQARLGNGLPSYGPQACLI